jgi:ABC-type polysaccharide/polyol phosphate export permease
MRLSARNNYASELSETARDFIGAFRKLPLAVNLAFQDILTRYRGSIIGPWWITITMGALVLGIGINYAALFHQPISELLPYVAFGLVIWGFISSSISEGGEAFVASGAIIRQSALPLPLFVLRCVIRNYVNLAHHLVIIIGVMLWFRIFPGVGLLWIVPGLVLVTLNLAWLSLLLAVISARFRDVPQIVTAVLQFVFFLSPIFWKAPPEMANSFLVRYNPFSLAVEAIRRPALTGECPSHAFLFLSILAVVGWVGALLVYNQIRRRVVHFL